MQALKNIAEDYDNKIGKVVQREGGGKKVINQLVVEKTLISPNLKKAIIPGSSLKGAIATAFGEMLYKKSKSYDTKEYFSDFLVADSEVIESHTFASVATNIKRNMASRDQNASQGIPVRYEAINSKSEFKTRFGKDLWEVYGKRKHFLEEFFEKGQLVEEDDILRITEKGFDISNNIMAVFV